MNEVFKGLIYLLFKKDILSSREVDTLFDSLSDGKEYTEFIGALLDVAGVKQEVSEGEKNTHISDGEVYKY